MEVNIVGGEDLGLLLLLLHLLLLDSSGAGSTHGPGSAADPRVLPLPLAPVVRMVVRVVVMVLVVVAVVRRRTMAVEHAGRLSVPRGAGRSAATSSAAGIDRDEVWGGRGDAGATPSASSSAARVHDRGLKNRHCTARIHGVNFFRDTPEIASVFLS